MRLERMGASHQTRLSFLRALLRMLKHDRWSFDRPVWNIDAAGIGHAVYRAKGPQRVYSLVCFSQELAPDKRTDRVIAEEWDTSYVLFDGEPGEADIARLAHNVPKQEAGRYLPSDLVLSRANKSVRLFERVVSALAEGRQPDRTEIESVGYLMRTTAVYGNGKFGIADRDVIAGRREFDGPFRAEMLTVWLIRSFTVDLAEHIAAMRSPGTAVALAPALRRRFGVGNSTGLGMAPFLVKHPVLIHRWVLARETALARVRALARADDATGAAFARTLQRARGAMADWTTEDPILMPRIHTLREDLDRLQQEVRSGVLDQAYPWDHVYRWAESNLGLDAQEFVVSLVIEPHGPLVDDLAETMSADEDERFAIDGTMTIDQLRTAIERQYLWALSEDYSRRQAQARFWYTSVEKLEPRLGERWQEPGAELEQPLGTGRDIAALHAALAGMPGDAPIARLLLAAPEHRHAARRVQIAMANPYAEIHDNLLASTVRPIDILRCKLAFFGATKFDPRSDRWLRINLFQGAPFPGELAGSSAEDWVYAYSAEALT